MKAISIVALLASSAGADPELGTSTKGRTFWPDRTVPQVSETWAVSRHGRPFVYDWTATVGGVEISHDRYYELVGHPEVVHAKHRRILLGALAIATGIAASAFGGYEVVGKDHMLGLVPFFGGFLVGFGGTMAVLQPDPSPVGLGLSF